MLHKEVCQRSKHDSIEGRIDKKRQRSLVANIMDRHSKRMQDRRSENKREFTKLRSKQFDEILK